jgi:cytosine/adenosine deaminase-related metal-dependent hydrolase
VIKDGVVVYDGNRVEFVGKEYTQPVDKKVDAEGCLVSPGFIDTHFHSGINASDYILNDSTKTDFFASNYLAHGGPTREGAHSAHLKDVDIGQRYSLIHVLKSGVTTTFDIGGAGSEPERYVDMIDQVGIRCVVRSRVTKRQFLSRPRWPFGIRLGRRARQQGFKSAVDFAKRFNGVPWSHDCDALPGHVDSCIGVAQRHQEGGQRCRRGDSDSRDD